MDQDSQKTGKSAGIKREAKYQLINETGENTIRVGIIVTWSEEQQAYFSEMGLPFSKNDVELSGNWKPI